MFTVLLEVKTVDPLTVRTKVSVLPAVRFVDKSETAKV